MSDILNEIYVPLTQLYIYLALLFFVLVVKWFSMPSLIMSGVNLLLLWMLTSSIIGISRTFDWYYYLELTASLAAGYLILWLFVLVIDKLRPGYNSEGSIYILAPLTLSVFIILPALVMKAIWHVLVDFL